MRQRNLKLRVHPQFKHKIISCFIGEIEELVLGTFRDDETKTSASASSLQVDLSSKSGKESSHRVNKETDASKGEAENIAKETLDASKGEDILTDKIASEIKEEPVENSGWKAFEDFDNIFSTD